MSRLRVHVDTSATRDVVHDALLWLARSAASVGWDVGGVAFPAVYDDEGFAGRDVHVLGTGKRFPGYREQRHIRKGAIGRRILCGSEDDRRRVLAAVRSEVASLTAGEYDIGVVDAVGPHWLICLFGVVHTVDSADAKSLEREVVAIADGRCNVVVNGFSASRNSHDVMIAPWLAGCKSVCPDVGLHLLGDTLDASLIDRERAALLERVMRHLETNTPAVAGEMGMDAAWA